MKTKKLGVGGKLVSPAYTAADVAVSGELDPADVGQSVMGLGSKFLNRLGGGAAMLLKSKDLNEGEDDPNSPYQKARMAAINKNRVQRGKAAVPHYARGGGIETRGKTKGRFV
jgi:hypothetical protein